MNALAPEDTNCPVCGAELTTANAKTAGGFVTAKACDECGIAWPVDLPDSVEEDDVTLHENHRALEEYEIYHPRVPSWAQDSFREPQPEKQKLSAEELEEKRRASRRRIQSDIFIGRNEPGEPAESASEVIRQMRASRNQGDPSFVALYGGDGEDGEERRKPLPGPPGVGR